MDRRTDHNTAERVNITLLTRTAFDEAAALSFAKLSGMCEDLARDVLSRPLSQVRHYTSIFLRPTDRRSYPRAS